MPFSSRGVMARQVGALAARGLRFTAGVEVECHILTRGGDPAADGQPATPALLNPGYQYLTELRYDALDPLMETLRATLQALNLPLRTLEVEFGPSQVELTFGPAQGVLPADQLILVRSAVKQVCARNGLVASIMSRPRLPGVVSSGWHDAFHPWNAALSSRQASSTAWPDSTAARTPWNSRSRSAATHRPTGSPQMTRPLRVGHIKLSSGVVFH